jgi:hypothetical protein
MPPSRNLNSFSIEMLITIFIIRRKFIASLSRPDNNKSGVDYQSVSGMSIVGLYLIQWDRESKKMFGSGNEKTKNL